MVGGGGGGEVEVEVGVGVVEIGGVLVFECFNVFKIAVIIFLVSSEGFC
jgi:hypothetical protein